MTTRHERVLLYSTTLHCWEVWAQGRPIGHGTLKTCQEAYPDALPVSEQQMTLARADATARNSGDAQP